MTIKGTRVRQAEVDYLPSRGVEVVRCNEHNIDDRHERFNKNELKHGSFTAARGC